MPTPFRWPRAPRERSRGQSLVEFAIALPVLLLLLLTAIDFGRVYLGWINTQNMARIAANFAANNASAFGSPGDATVRAQYEDLVLSDAAATNCTLWDPGSQAVLATPPFPTFVDVDGNGQTTDIGDQAHVAFNCRFNVITPGISQIVGSLVNVSAESAFPVKTGMTATGTGGGGGSPVAPTAAFAANPLTQAVNVPVVFTDESGGTPTAWQWDFGDPTSASNSATTQDASHSFANPGAYTVSLTVYNAAGQDTTTKIISISSASGAAFHGEPLSGESPLDVQFFDDSTGTPISWLWDFGDGTTSTQESPLKTYTSATSRTYDVRLTVTYADTTTSTITIDDYISIDPPLCEVPSLIGVKRNKADDLWHANGFTTNVTNAPGAPNGNGWTITFQDLTAPIEVPCGATIQVNG